MWIEIAIQVEKLAMRSRAPDQRFRLPDGVEGGAEEEEGFCEFVIGC